MASILEGVWGMYSDRVAVKSSGYFYTKMF